MGNKFYYVVKFLLYVLAGCFIGILCGILVNILTIAFIEFFTRFY